MNTAFWRALDELLASSRIVIDRPKGSFHPRFSHLFYPIDYGYLENTASMDGGGIDVWLGSQAEHRLDAIVCTVDLMKRDSEIKLLLGCTQEEKRAVLALHNDSQYMKGILICREEDADGKDG